MRAITLKMSLIIVGLLFHSYAEAQSASYIKGKHYIGYAFPKEFAINGYHQNHTDILCAARIS